MVSNSLILIGHRIADIETMRNESGVTLIELMITLVVAGVLLAIAIPSFQSFMISNTLNSVSTDLFGSLNYARSEAVTRGDSVTVCPSSTGSTCGGSWSGGWIIFVDHNFNGAVDTGDKRLRVHRALTTNYSAASSLTDSSGATVSYLTYMRNGMANDTGTLAVCYQNDRTKSKAISVTTTRPRIAPDTDGNNIPNKEDGSDITSCTNP